MPTLITAALETVVNTGSQNLYTITTVGSTAGVNPGNVVIANTAGGFTTDSFRSYRAGDTVTVSGTQGGTGAIIGYTDPTTYYIVATNQSSNFVLSATPGGANVITTAGTTTGMSFVASGTVFPPVTGATQFNTATSPQQVVFSTITANVGTAITANVTSGVFGLANVANIAYQLNGYVEVTATPATYGWVNTATGAAIGPTAPAGIPLSTTFLNPTANTVNVALRVSTLDGAPFAVPAQIRAAAATVSQVSGYTVA
jgi:hypothetical protein